jgi:hypothetical protein
LPIVGLQPVEQFPASGIREGFEDLVHRSLYATNWLHVKNLFIGGGSHLSYQSASKWAQGIRTFRRFCRHSAVRVDAAHDTERKRDFH